MNNKSDSSMIGVIPDRLRRIKEIAEAAGLSVEQYELLASALEEEGISAGASNYLCHDKNRDKGPTTFAQQRLWFLAQLNPTSASYNIPVAVKLCGDRKSTRLNSSH